MPVENEEEFLAAEGAVAVGEAEAAVELRVVPESLVDAEAINGVIETTRRIARGFRNFTNCRIRCLLAAVGHHPYRTKSTNHA